MAPPSDCLGCKNLSRGALFWAGKDCRRCNIKFLDSLSLSQLAADKGSAANCLRCLCCSSTRFHPRPFPDCLAAEFFFSSISVHSSLCFTSEYAPLSLSGFLFLIRKFYFNVHTLWAIFPLSLNFILQTENVDYMVYLLAYNMRIKNNISMGKNHKLDANKQ